MFGYRGGETFVAASVARHLAGAALEELRGTRAERTTFALRLKLEGISEILQADNNTGLTLLSLNIIYPRQAGPIKCFCAPSRHGHI